jgi:Cys-tRNA(Pro)/Cys-tRNA(Cys) deacylase
MAKATPATMVLQQAGISFALHEYDYDPDAPRIGMQAADALGIAPARLLKTLMTKAGAEVTCALLPSDRELNLKRLAAAAGVKSAAMLASTEAERITGYHVGGISPLGQRRAVPTWVDESALGFATVFLNGGRRGLQIEMAPADLIRVLGARTAILASD